ILGYVRYTRRGTALPCPYTRRYNVVPHLNGNCYISGYTAAASRLLQEAQPPKKLLTPRFLTLNS
ncbi:hypothetical protein, partial [Tolypothrix sp. VBCCA 56010]|uniref:hypothetical protein n=1 Tax=Tolypothrix sp. VBCCA 56010 TaxID=3137731 RepID=UPI003D7D7A4D